MQEGHDIVFDCVPGSPIETWPKAIRTRSAVAVHGAYSKQRLLGRELSREAVTGKLLTQVERAEVKGEGAVPRFTKIPL